MEAPAEALAQNEGTPLVSVWIDASRERTETESPEVSCGDESGVCNAAPGRCVMPVSVGATIVAHMRISE